MVPSGVWPLTASGPSATFPVHPASHRQHTLASASRDTVNLEVYWIIGSLLVCHALDRKPLVQGALASSLTRDDCACAQGAHVVDPRRIAAANNCWRQLVIVSSLR